MPYAQFAQQAESAERMMLEMRKTVIEEYRSRGYIVQEHDDEILIERGVDDGKA